jgi:hypothetical protein
MNAVNNQQSHIFAVITKTSLNFLTTQILLFHFHSEKFKPFHLELLFILE